MNPLQAGDFAPWFEAVHGVAPFPWQARLAAEVLEQGRWPEVLALPTAAGKTSVLDVALFCLAVRPTGFARRIVLVIDRRVVVDQAAQRAQRLLDAHCGLATSGAESPLVRRVAESLRAIWRADPAEPPFECATLRGGMPREDAWARRPDCPVLAVSTVDQVGTRLMFRGYGVSSRMSSVHAGLLGQDTLFLLDEVHLSEPFAQTLLALRDRWRPFHPAPMAERWGVVRMSATPGVKADGERRFGMQDPGWVEDRAHPVLRKRLLARKHARLQLVPVSGRHDADKVAALGRAAAEVARQHLRNGARRVAVVLNRVQGARTAAESLQAVVGEPGFDVQLLTGRMRPLDRDDVLKGLLPRITAGSPASSGESGRALVVVATQCIEAGADFDFDGLVTECASLDALRQRFGRLDRLGELGQTSADVLVRSDQIIDGADVDPIYGRALAETWKCLGGAGAEVDFGIEAMDERIGGLNLLPLLAPRPKAPILLPAHLDLLAQTHPRPQPDPYLPDWLHGPQRGEPEVQVVWRADLAMETLQAEASDLAPVVDRLLACPPTSLDSLSLPISAVRRWLRSAEEASLADVAISLEDDERSRGPVTPARPALAWSGEDSRVVLPDAIRPGMTLVVPCAYGGLRDGNWNPDATEPATDLAERALWQARGQASLRLDNASLPAVLSVRTPPRTTADEPLPQRREQVADWLAWAQDQGLLDHWPPLLAALRRRLRIVEHGDGGLTLLGGRPANAGASSEDDGASFTDEPVTLVAHSSEVRAWAQRFVGNLGLDAKLASDVTLAAWLHDVGKADPRFQRWLVGGSDLRLALMDAPLAKSAQSSADQRALRDARLRAGYPEGYRHELLSVAMLERQPDVMARAYDADLVLHLVGSHHGWCRPFAPAVEDVSPALALVRLPGEEGCGAVSLESSTEHRLGRLDSGVADRFWRLNRRYGWWGLAWLEAIVRLADHRASEPSAVLTPEVNHAS